MLRNIELHFLEGYISDLFDDLLILECLQALYKRTNDNFKLEDRLR